MIKAVIQAYRGSVLRALGLTSFWRWWNRHRITVLMIHGVIEDCPEDQWQPLRWQLKAAELRRQLDCLSQIYEFVTPEEGVAMIRGDIPIRPNCIVVTIDDGYRNAYSVAWPILSEFKITPLVFISTAMVDSGEQYWFDRLDVALQTARSVNSVQLRDQTIDIDRSNRKALAQSCRNVIRRSRKIYSCDRERLEAIEELTKWLFAKGITNSNSDIRSIKEKVGVLTSEEIQRASREGMTFGSHCVSHVRLPFIESNSAREEVSSSKAKVEELSGKACNFFCYPEGCLNEEVVNMVRDAGYEAAFTSDPRLNSPGSDILQIGRIHVPREATPAELLATVSGLNESIHRLRMQLRMGRREAQNGPTGWP